MTPPGQMSLLEPTPEPTQGRVRKSDPQTSSDAAKTTGAPQQRRFIAGLFLTRDSLTADDVWAADLRPDDEKPERGTYSTRLGGMVDDGLLVKGDPVLREHRKRTRLVVSYHLTPQGRSWVRDLTSERGAA